LETLLKLDQQVWVWTTLRLATAIISSRYMSVGRINGRVSVHGGRYSRSGNVRIGMQWCGVCVASGSAGKLFHGHCKTRDHERDDIDGFPEYAGCCARPKGQQLSLCGIEFNTYGDHPTLPKVEESSVSLCRLCSDEAGQ